MRRGLGGQFSNRQHAGVGALACAGVFAAAIAGCAPGTAESTSGFSGGGGAANTSSAGSGKTTSATGTGGDDFNPVSGSGSTGTSTGTGEGCAGTSSEATLTPVNMFIMFDKSKSMDDNGKWVAAKTALTDFFKDQGSAGLRVALRFFPDTGCDETVCTTNTCDVPLVPLAALTSDAAPADSQEKKLVDAVTSKTPSGGTPMSAALGGAEKWAAAYQTAHLGEKTVVVLVTDGEPSDCELQINVIAGLALKAKNSNGILTYAVGLVGSKQATMDAIAAAGGTSKGILIGNGNASAELLAALKVIQGSQVACDFQMPKMGSMGEMIDPSLVNVNYTPGDGSPVKGFGQVAKASDCAGQTAGWFYDNPGKPTTITLCPATCTSVQADAKAKIDIQLGCATKPAQ